MASVFQRESPLVPSMPSLLNNLPSRIRRSIRGVVPVTMLYHFFTLSRISENKVCGFGFSRPTRRTTWPVPHAA